MKQLRLLILLMTMSFITSMAVGQKEDMVEVPPPPPDIVEDERDGAYQLWEVNEEPRFPGGDSAYHAYLKYNLNYPDSAIMNGIEGMVVLEFEIDTLGRTGNIRVLKSVGYGLDEEASRLIKEMPAWKPAILRGRKVRCMYRYPVRFRLH